MNADAGAFDRRIQVQVVDESQDAAGDLVQSWRNVFKRWSIRVDARGREFFGAQQMVREADTAFEVRHDSQTRTIAPETHRVIDSGRIFEIVGICEGRERRDTLILLCSSSPALRGSRAPIDASA